MRNNQNKHGPDVDVGRWYTWLRMPDVLTGLPPPWKATKDRCGPELKLRIEDCACLLGAVRQGLRIEEHRLTVGLLLNRKSKIENPKLNGPPSPDPRPPERDWPPGSSISQKRRRQRPRSTIVKRRTGESPPGIVDDLITNYIDSLAHRKRSVRKRNVPGAQTTVIPAMGGLCPGRRVKENGRRRDKGTRRMGEKEKGRKGRLRDEENERWSDEGTKPNQKSPSPSGEGAEGG